MGFHCISCSNRVRLIQPCMKWHLLTGPSGEKSYTYYVTVYNAHHNNYADTQCREMVNDNFDQIFNLYNPAVYKVADVIGTHIHTEWVWKI